MRYLILILFLAGCDVAESTQDFIRHSETREFDYSQDIVFREAYQYVGQRKLTVVDSSDYSITTDWHIDTLNHNSNIHYIENKLTLSANYIRPRESELEIGFKIRDKDLKESTISVFGKNVTNNISTYIGR